MKPLLNPKLDIVFKQLFSTDEEILVDLLNAVLQLSGEQQIRSIQVKNPQILPEDIAEKYILLDIRATDNRQHQYDIEMQARKFPAYAERAVYYLSRLYASQLESGEQYHKLKPVIGIHFLDFQQFSGHEAYHYCFEMRDETYPNLRLTEQFTLHLLELPTFEQQMRRAPWGESLAEWLHFLNHAPEEEDDSMQAHYTNPAVHKAFTVLEKISNDDEARYRAEAREMALKNRATELMFARTEGLEEGRQEGRQEGTLIGAIRTMQEVLHQSVTASEDLQHQPADELRRLLEHLKAQMRALQPKP